MKLVPQCVSSAWRKVSHWHGAAVASLTARPILLLGLVLPYLIATTLVAFLCNKVATLVVFLVSQLGLFSEIPRALLIYEVAKSLFLLFSTLLWLHYLVLAAGCLKEAVRLRMTILGVTQLVAVTVFIFAAAHYYVALLSDGKAYMNVEQPVPMGGWNDSDLIDRLSFVPTPETVVDFIYFSTVTTATVGYGDITPVTMLAKLLTVAQIGVSFVLVAVALGWIIGKAETLRSPAGENTGPQ